MVLKILGEVLESLEAVLQKLSSNLQTFINAHQYLALSSEKFRPPSKKIFSRNETYIPPAWHIYQVTKIQCSI